MDPLCGQPPLIDHDARRDDIVKTVVGVYRPILAVKEEGIVVLGRQRPHFVGRDGMQDRAGQGRLVQEKTSGAILTAERGQWRIDGQCVEGVDPSPDDLPQRTRHQQSGM